MAKSKLKRTLEQKAEEEQVIQTWLKRKPKRTKKRRKEKLLDGHLTSGFVAHLHKTTDKKKVALLLGE